MQNFTGVAAFPPSLQASGLPTADSIKLSCSLLNINICNCESDISFFLLRKLCITLKSDLILYNTSLNQTSILAVFNDKK